MGNLSGPEEQSTGDFKQSASLLEDPSNFDLDEGDVNGNPSGSTEESGDTLKRSASPLDDPSNCGPNAVADGKDNPAPPEKAAIVKRLKSSSMLVSKGFQIVQISYPMCFSN
eukprot:5413136-Karenia_brevis.AAC.1